MKIIIAPNALKGSLSAIDASKVIEQGVLRAFPNAETICVPIADGGDGLLAILQSVVKAKVIKCEVTGPLGKQVQTHFLYCADKKLAIIELALASGLTLIDSTELNVNRASTIGVGEIICMALTLDVKQLILGIGGSASNDAGVGIASALGVKFLDRNGTALFPCAQNLIDVFDIDIAALNPLMKKVDFEIICDVQNPLLGPTGSAAIFAKQKGATDEDIFRLEKGMSHFADILEHTFCLNVREIEGGGAAGGVGAGMMAMFNAKLRKGTDVIFKLLELDKHLHNADLLITAEGKLDSQSQYGKGASAAAILAKKVNVPSIIIAGQVDTGSYPEYQNIISLTSQDTSNKAAMKHVRALIEAKVEKFISQYFNAHQNG